MEVRISYWNDYAIERMQLYFAERAAHHFKDGDYNIYGIPSIADQRVFLTAQVGKVKDVATSGGGAVQRSPRRLSIWT